MRKRRWHTSPAAKPKRAYQRGDRREKRRRLMAKWAAFWKSQPEVRHDQSVGLSSAAGYDEACHIHSGYVSDTRLE